MSRGIEQDTDAGPMGEAHRGARRLDVDRRRMLQFRSSVITSDGGSLAYRELDDLLSLTARVPVCYAIPPAGHSVWASQMGGFETKRPSRSENLAALAHLPGQWIDKVLQRHPPTTIHRDPPPRYYKRGNPVQTSSASHDQ